MSLVDDLELVGQLMRAYFIDLEQVNHGGLLVNVEVPHAVQLTSNAMGRLISFSRWSQKRRNCK